MKVLILSCGTGGGHNSAALAIQENLIKRGIQADFIEYLDIINKNLKNRVNNLYIKSTKHKGKLFKRAYKLGELYSKTRIPSPVYGLNSLNKNKLYKYICDNNYDCVITTHLFVAEVLTAIKKVHSIPFIAVCTDYVCIPFWEETNPDYFIIPNEALKKDFTSKGIPAKKLLPYGIPVSSKYQQTIPKDLAKEKLKLNPISDYILILNGSMGFESSSDVLEKLLKTIPNVVFLVSCGNNSKMLNTINKNFSNTKRVIAFSYSNNLDEYMSASEIVLTKPGGLTSTEVATMGKPFIHTLPIPGCENYNANYFANRKMSLKCTSLDEVVENTKLLFNDKALQSKLVKNQNRLIPKNTCDKITELILNEINSIKKE